MNIVIVCTQLSWGGVEQILLNTINELLREGNQIHLIILLKKEGVLENKFFESLSPTVSVKFIYQDKMKKKLNLFCRFEQYFFPFRIQRRIKKLRPDIVISYVENIDSINVISNLKIPKYVFVHNFVDNNNPLSLHERIVINKYKQNLKKIDKVICVSDSCKEQYMKVNNIPEEKMKVVYNYIPTDKIKTLSNEFEIDKKVNGILRFCYAGRLAKEKGVLRMIRSFCRLAEEKYKFELLVCGEGYLKNECMEIVRQANCEDKIKFIGYCENPYPYIKDSDWYICASKKESFGLSVLEAIVLDTHVLSTKCHGVEDIILQVGGAVLVENTEEALYCGIKEVLEGQIVCPKANDVENVFGEKRYFKELKKVLLIEE